MGETGGVRESSQQPQVGGPAKFVKEHWVEIALGVGVVAGLIIGVLAQTDVIHHVGTLSSAAITKFALTGMVASGVGLIVKDYLSMRKDSQTEHNVTSEAISQIQPPPKQTAQPEESYPTLQMIKIPGEEDKESAPSMPSIEGEDKESAQPRIQGPLIHSFYMPTDANTAVVKKALAVSNFDAKDQLKEIARMAEGKNPNQAAKIIQEKLNLTIPKNTSIVVELEDRFIVRGRAILFNREPFRIQNYEATYNALEIPKTEVGKNDLLFFGTDKAIDTLQQLQDKAMIIGLTNPEDRLSQLSELLENAQIKPDEYHLIIGE